MSSRGVSRGKISHMSKEILSGKPHDSQEQQEDVSMRPKTLREMSGRREEREAIRILIDAAKKRKQSVDHILFHGPPGLGKTTFAFIIAGEMGSHVRITSGPAVERQGDLAAILTNLKDGDILFIDEIHRLNRGVEEILYPAMEDFKLDIIVGKGPSARSVRLKLPRFTLIGATTRIGYVSAPLRSRFGFLQRLDYYTDEDLLDIILRAAKLMKVKIDKAGAQEIARSSRGTARISLRLLRRASDYCLVECKSDTITSSIARDSLDKLGVDALGLDDLDRQILNVIIEKFSGGPVGLSTIAAAVSEEVDTVSEVYEPFLMQKGLIKRTSRGRVATQMAFEHLGIPAKKESKEQPKLI